MNRHYSLRTNLMKPSEVSYGFDLHAILGFRFSDLKTIEDRGDGDPNGVIGEVKAWAEAHTRTLRQTQSRWNRLAWKVLAFSNPKAVEVSIIEGTFQDQMYLERGKGLVIRVI
jgi:hypothetical protein